MAIGGVTATASQSTFVGGSIDTGVVTSGGVLLAKGTMDFMTLTATINIRIPGVVGPTDKYTFTLPGSFDAEAVADLDIPALSPFGLMGFGCLLLLTMYLTLRRRIA